jgi:hypothetical protein
VLGIVLATQRILTAGFELVALILPAGALFGVALIYFTSVDFWSEFIYVNYGTTKPSEDDLGPGASAASHRIIRAWTGVARSENWQSKAGHGRAMRQVFPSPLLDDALVNILAKASEDSGSTALQ